MKRADLFVVSANGNILPKAVSGQSMGNQNGSESKDGDFFLGCMYDSVRHAQLAAQDIQHDEKDKEIGRRSALEAVAEMIERWRKRIQELKGD